MASIVNYQEYVDHLVRDETTDYKNPNCMNCNECCGITAIITEEEKRTIKKFLRSPQGRDIYKFSLSKYKNMKRNGVLDLRCPFSSKSKKCLIYNIRPSICKDYHCSPSLDKRVGGERVGTGLMIIDIFR